MNLRYADYIFRFNNRNGRFFAMKGWLAIAIVPALLWTPVRSLAEARGEISSNGTTTVERPFSAGKEFANLDEYLAHLKRLGTIDAPYYEKQPDGRYLHIRGRRPPGPGDVYTRQELLRTFGFEY